MSQTPLWMRFFQVAWAVVFISLIVAYGCVAADIGLRGAFPIMEIVVAPIVGLLLAAGAILLLIEWLNRRDDPHHAAPPPDEAIFDSFSQQSKKVLQTANDESARLNHGYVGTEHILLGLLKDVSGITADVFRSSKVDPDRFRAEVERVSISGPETGGWFANFPQTPRAKSVIRYAVDEQLNLRHECVGPEHILLGLLREREGVAAQLLFQQGLTLESVRTEIVGPPRRSAGGSDLSV